MFLTEESESLYVYKVGCRRAQLWYKTHTVINIMVVHKDVDEKTQNSNESS